MKNLGLLTGLLFILASCSTSGERFLASSDEVLRLGGCEGKGLDGDPYQEVRLDLESSKLTYPDMNSWENEDRVVTGIVQLEENSSGYITVYLDGKRTFKGCRSKQKTMVELAVQKYPKN